jgi:hypothetical protein
VLVVILLELEKALGCPLIHCFDWVAGTSTGGILTLGLAAGSFTAQCTFVKLPVRPCIGQTYAYVNINFLLTNTYISFFAVF